MTSPHPLDRPIWSALNHGERHLTDGGARARRLDPEYGLFAAAASNSADDLAALSVLIAPHPLSWLVETTPLDVPGYRAACSDIAQMVMEAPPPAIADADIVALTEADADAMRALAALTQPGPFFTKTHRLGQFYGIRHAGALVAMTGERMHPNGFAEVSAVCTHPDHRGKGLAAALVVHVTRAMLARGETPYLHAYAANIAATALYERLGFRLRRQMILTALTVD